MRSFPLAYLLLCLAASTAELTREQWEKQREDTAALRKDLLARNPVGTGDYSYDSGSDEDHEDDPDNLAPETVSETTAAPVTVKKGEDGSAPTEGPAAEEQESPQTGAPVTETDASVTTLAPVTEGDDSVTTVGPGAREQVSPLTEAPVTEDQVPGTTGSPVTEENPAMTLGNPAGVPAALAVTWKHLKMVALKALEAQGPEVAEATRRILKSNSKDLGTRYNPDDSMLTSVAEFLMRSAGFATNPDESSTVGVSGRILWNQAFSGLQQQAMHLAERSQEDSISAINQVSHERMIKSIMVAVSFLLTLSTWALCSSIFKAVKYWKARREEQRQKKRLRDQENFRDFAAAERRQDAARLEDLAERGRILPQPAIEHQQR